MRGPASSTGEDQRPLADPVAGTARRGASPDQTGRSSPRRRLARAPLVISLLAWVLAGCSASDRAIPRDDAGSVTAPIVRTDREPLAERFPELGSFGDPHWLGSAMGDPGDARVPGPTDVAIRGFVVLAVEDRAAVKNGYVWAAAPAGWESRIAAQLRQYVPAGATWRYNREFAQRVRTDAYRGEDIYLDVGSGTVYLDVTTA